MLNEKARFRLYHCINCDSSINSKMDLYLTIHELDNIILCCDHPNINLANVTQTDIVWLESHGDGYWLQKFVKAFTYEPKIKAILDKTCKQTIRPLGKQPIERGDEILFHGWQDRPYFSKWSWQIRVKVSRVNKIQMFQDGILEGGLFFKWDQLDYMAIADGIKRLKGKGYGESMGILFNEMYGDELAEANATGKGKEMEVIQWEDFVKDGD